jgi:hypothetical protein
LFISNPRLDLPTPQLEATTLDLRLVYKNIYTHRP